LPGDQREQIECLDELHGFLEQSNISAKNIARLEILTQHTSGEVRHLATMLLEIARVKPHKRRRWRFLAREHPGLFARLKTFCGDDFSDKILASSLDSPNWELPF
jgi:hypothetical protein